MKKCLALLLIAALCMSLCYFGVAEEKPTITIGIKNQSQVQDYETNLYTQHLEEVFNCNLDFVVYSDMDKKLSLEVISGDKLPDVICHKLDVNTTWKYVQAGAFRDLTAYYEDPEFNANLVAAQEIVPGYLDYVVMPDGHYYSIPFYQREINSEIPNKVWLNFQWLEELGLEEPVTTEDFYNVLKAFKEAHPNCYPLTGHDSSTQGNIVLYIMNAFIYDDQQDFLNYDENGQLTVSYIDDRWKQGLEFARRLVDEGLFDATWITADRQSQLVPLLNEEECIVGGFLNQGNKLFNDLSDGARWSWYKGIAPLTGPDGVSYACYAQAYAQNMWFVTKDCPDELVDLAVKIGIFMHDPTEEEFIINRYGEKGVDWLEPTSEKSVFWEMGFKARFIMVGDIWSVVQNKTWRKEAPVFVRETDQAQQAPEDPEAYVGRIAQAAAKVYPHLPQEGEYVPVLLYNEEETEQIGEIRSNLKSYVNECSNLFITREMSLEDDWDEFIATVYAMGLEEFLAVSQGVYNRMFVD